MLDEGLGQTSTIGGMKAAGVSIGEVVRRTGLSVHTLRMYEREGLLIGEVRRDDQGRRVYTAWDIEWLGNCVKFRASGMPLATIRQLAQLVREGTGNEAQRLELLREHRRRVTEQIAQLHDCLALVDSKVAAYEQHLAAGGAGDPWQPPAQAPATTPRPDADDRQTIKQ